MAKRPPNRMRDDDIVDMGLVLRRCREFISERLSTTSLTEEEVKRASFLPCLRARIGQPGLEAK